MERIVRFTQPTKYDPAPQGTIWECRIDPTCSTVYIQVSDESTKPQWITIGLFLEKIFTPELKNREFIDNCLSRYHHS